MKKFFISLLLFSIIPLLIIIPYIYIYVKKDIYQDFGPYKNYSWKYHFQSLGDIATKKLLQSSEKYNSFIFGSSRSCFLYACYLQANIKDSKFFHYANWNERIGGIEGKLKLLDSLGYALDNVVIYFDADNTFAEDGVDYVDHYLLTHQDKIDYYLDHFMSFFPPDLDKVKFNILFRNINDEEAFPDWTSDIHTNDSRHICSNETVENYGKEPIKPRELEKMDSLKKIGYFYKRADYQQYQKEIISLPELAMMRQIKQILDKHRSKYYIVITPLYDQMKFNARDSKLMEDVFGKQHIFDFSGRNSITKEVENYPDRSHFKPYISKFIADSVILHKKTDLHL